MSLEKALADLERKGFLDRVMELEASTATAAQAAEALGVEPGRIAKTMSFLQEDMAVLILTEGTARIDNHKYKETFHVKAKMIPFDEVEARIGHAPGGVCPSAFGTAWTFTWTKAFGNTTRSIPPQATITAPSA